MAKALLGHLPTADPRALHEVMTLRRRIAALECQVDDLQTALALATSGRPSGQAAAESLDLDLDLEHELSTLDAEHAAASTV